MIIIPTIELQGGKCVSLNRGNVDQPTIWHVDPVEKAREFASAGASWVHVTDIDGASGAGENADLIGEIVRKAGIPVQLAGGFRSAEMVDQAIDGGAGRVVIGTAAVQDPGMVRELAKKYPDQIVLAVDVYQGKVVMDGWRASTAFEPVDFVKEFETAPLAAILVTDIDAYAGDSDGSVGMISQVAEAARSPVIASGIVSGLDDVSRLKYVRNISGALVGRALFSKAVDLREALAVAQVEPSERTAEMI